MSAPLVEHLPWDTDFFGFSVGRLILPGAGVGSGELKSILAKADETLTYVFLPVGGGAENETERPRSALVSLGAKCCDLKTVYRKTINPATPLNGSMGAAATTLTPSLESLAYASGWCSRFVMDERLSRFYKPMYFKWLKRELAEGRVFVRPNADSPEGMASVSVRNGIGKIGLVAVDAKHCGKGLGSALLHDIDMHLIQQGVTICEVVTQGMNIAARNLYEKCGYALQSQTEVWHVWKK